jgi:hypothetical protein
LFEKEVEVLEKLGKHEQIPHLLASFEEDKILFICKNI